MDYYDLEIMIYCDHTKTSTENYLVFIKTLTKEDPLTVFLAFLSLEFLSYDQYLEWKEFLLALFCRYHVIIIDENTIHELPKISKYLFDISQYILLPLYSFVRLFVYSFDVIHTLGIYSWGVKIDAIPGRINVATTLRLLNKGEYRGKCFELCGQGHLSMAIVGLVL